MARRQTLQLAFFPLPKRVTEDQMDGETSDTSASFLCFDERGWREAKHWMAQSVTYHSEFSLSSIRGSRSKKVTGMRETPWPSETLDANRTP